MTTPPPPPSPAHAPKRSWWRAVWVLPVALLIVGVAIGSSASPREKTVAGPTMHVTTITGPTTIDIRSSDYAFKSSGGCAWSRVG